MSERSRPKIDGLLVIDKPIGPTSHDVVAHLRRTLGERRIGHTGTLDPLASGVLPLVVGRATRLARFLASSDKAYEAEVELGSSTTTYDREGEVVGTPYEGEWPSRHRIETALMGFRGTAWQTPPRYSAKKIAGRRSYRTARSSAKRAEAGMTDEPSPIPAPVVVSVRVLELIEVDVERLPLRLRLRLECSAGFYVRSLAHDLGERLGTGGHLVALRRTRSGDLRLDAAVALDTATSSPTAALAALIPIAKMLPGLPAVTLSEEGVRLATCGQDVGPGLVAPTSTHVFAGTAPAAEENEDTDAGCPVHFRLLAPDGELVAIAERVPKSGLLHPSVVLV